MNNKIIPIFIPHQGCPQQCVFCNQSEITSASAPTAAEVSAQIASALEYTQNPQIAFYGGSFTAIDAAMQEEYLQAAFAFVLQNRAQSIRVSTRPDAISVDILARLKKYRVATIELGAQSMNNDVLRAARRGHSAEHTVAAAKLIKAAGLELVLQVMAGLPGDSAEICRQTAREIARIEPHAVRIYPVCVLQNTPLYMMMQRGEYSPLTLEQAVERAADMMQIFAEKNIPAIRIGLNPSEELSCGAVVGGAYHPALGEMVYSMIWRRDAEKQIDAILHQNPDIKQINLNVAEKMKSKAHGQKNCNTIYFRERYPHIDIIL